MKRKLNDILINFRVRYNEQKDRFVLLLHGWGGSLNSFRGLEDFLADKNYSVINLDFPGFGASEMPPSHFYLNDYVEIVRGMLKELNIKKVSIVAHSFGGRVAIKLASLHDVVEKLILVDSAGIKQRFNLKVYLKQKYFKFLKILNKAGILHADLSKYGSEEYKAMPEELKPVFVRIIKEDLSPCLKDISCPTLLVWGSHDKITPLYMAKKIKKNVADCGIVVFKKAGHFSYLEYHDRFLLITDNFLRYDR